jgi:hypothetical protein
VCVRNMNALSVSSPAARHEQILSDFNLGKGYLVAKIRLLCLVLGV